MAKVKITGHASGTGILTVTAPNTSSDRTITLPDATGTLLNSDGSGASLTALNGTQVTSGTVPAARMPAGSVIQVVSATDGGYTTSSSSTYADTGLTAAITPSATSSKILVLVSHGTCEKRTNNTGMALRLLRGASEILKFAGQVGYSANTDIQSSSQSTTYLDSPATTSATTYKTQFKSNSDNALVGLHPDGDSSTIQLLEISG